MPVAEPDRCRSAELDDFHSTVEDPVPNHAHCVKHGWFSFQAGRPEFMTRTVERTPDDTSRLTRVVEVLRLGAPTGIEFDRFLLEAKFSVATSRARVR